MLKSQDLIGSKSSVNHLGPKVRKSPVILGSQLYVDELSKKTVVHTSR